jgi:hypothetical protein
MRYYSSPFSSFTTYFVIHPIPNSLFLIVTRFNFLYNEIRRQAAKFSREKLL